MNTIGLTLALRPAYASPVAGKQPATGIGVPEEAAMSRDRVLQSGFFAPMVCPQWQTGREEPQGSPVLPRYANFRFGLPPSIGVEGSGIQTANGKHITMAHTAPGASAPTIFNFRSAEVRTVTIDGEPWFVLSDVVDVLGFSRSRDSARMLDDDEKGAHIVRTPGGDQEVIIINESGVYSLALRSRKPEAKPFRKWVTSEVLPAIRKTGQYRAAPTLDVRAAMLDDNSDPIPMPPAIQALIDRKAWDMTHEAYALCQAFLARRVTYRCAYGYPQRYIDHAQARTVIDEASLGMALAPAHFNRLETLLRLSEMLADTTSDHRAMLRDEIKGVCNDLA